MNVAARLEGLAEPGGICIAQPVHRQIKSKLGIPLEPMGEHRVKNIAEPVEVWRVALDEAAPRMQKRRRLAPVALAASIAALLALGAGAWWWQHSRAAVQATATDPVRALPSRPTIAVLPFDNMSADPEQEYFADGITDDIISRMTQFKELGVIARNSTFQYKGVLSIFGRPAKRWAPVTFSKAASAVVAIRSV